MMDTAMAQWPWLVAHSALFVRVFHAPSATSSSGPYFPSGESRRSTCVGLFAVPCSTTTARMLTLTRALLAVTYCAVENLSAHFRDTAASLELVRALSLT